MSDSRRPKLGFLGTGWIGRHRMEAIHRAGDAEVAMICDPSPEMRDEARKTAPGAREAASFDEMLAAGLDGVVIATPSAQHAEQSRRALERGLAVFCQKPLGRTAREVRSVIEAARAADRLLDVDLSYRFTAGMQRVRNLVTEGAIGDVYGIDLIIHNAYGPDKPWFYNPELSGGGCVMDLGVHLVDLALWTLNFPRVDGVTSRLFAGGKPLADPRTQVEDFANARLDLAGGVAVQLACSWRLPAGCDAIIGATFYGTQGGLSWHNVGGSFYDFAAERFRGTARETITSPPDAWGGRAGVAWARRLAAGARFEPECERLVESAEALDRVYGRD